MPETTVNAGCETRVLVPLAPGCEELETVTVVDLLRRAGFSVVTASFEEGAIVASRGVKLVADTLLSLAMEAGPYDLIVLPGGMGGTQALAECDTLLAFLRAQEAAGRYVAAICAAPLALGKAGLLDNRVFTAYPGVMDGVNYPGAFYTGGVLEIDGCVVTSRGPGTALEFALTLIELLADLELREKVEKELKLPT